MDVVVAVDGSRYSRWALDWVAHLPFAKPITVTALHVVDLVSLRAPLTPHPVVVWNEAVVEAERRRLAREGRRIAVETRARFRNLGLKGKVVLERGAVTPAILRYARKRSTLVILGSRGLSALDRFLLGSVSARVAQQAGCSVLTVKQAARRPRRVLFATDGSRESARALEFFRRTFLPIELQARGAAAVIEVAVMHVMPFLRYPELKEPGRAVVTQAAERLERDGFRAEPVAKLGNPAEEILAHAENRRADLVVTGARGLGMAGRLLLGSVSTKLLHHSPCSVLIVR